jgi:methylenetetrahydrofolate reductase (NADPH)
MFKRFMEYPSRFEVKILAGIVLLVSDRMAIYMNEDVAGIRVPEKPVQAMAGAPKGKALQKGIEIAGEMIRQLKEELLCHGVYIMAIGKETVVPDILEDAGL